MLNNLKIRTKFFILVGFMIALLIGIGGLELISLSASNERLAASLDTAELSNESINTARSAQVHFKKQVQEWKNILLRGNDPEAFEKYSTNFTKEEEAVQGELEALKKLMEKQGLDTSAVDQTLKVHAQLGIKYREALISYDQVNPESYKIVDNLVKGIDRAPTEAIDSIVEQIEKIVVTTASDTQKRADNEFNKTRITFMVILLAGIGFASFLAVIFTRQIVKPLYVLKQELAALAENGGDLTQEINIRSKDEVGDLAQAVNKFLSNLRSMMIDINKNSNSVAETALQLSSNSQQVTAGANETAATMSEISTTVEQVTSNMQEIAKASEVTVDYASEGSQGIVRVSGQMQSINAVTKEVTKVIDGLSKKSQEITQIVELITTIADQTNLLALNAAIEAARAGEQGRGFAVVAEEVRKLAEGSAQAANNIKDLINSIQIESQRAVNAMADGGKEVETGTRIVLEVEGSFKEIINAVQDLTTEIQGVASAAEQMAAGVQNVAATTEEQTAAMEEVSASAESLAKLAEESNILVSKFNI